MKRKMRNWLALLMAVCLLAMIPAALSEGDVVSEAVEASEEAVSVELPGDGAAEPAEEVAEEAAEAPLPGEEYDDTSEEAEPEEVEVFSKEDMPVVYLDSNKKVTFQIGTVFKIETEKKPMVYRVANRNIATVNNGYVTVRRVGKTDIQVMLSEKETRVLTLVAVADPKVPTDISIEKPKSNKLDVSQTLTLNSKLVPETAETDLIWSSSDEKIATVQDGVVTPVSVGKVTIKVSTAVGSYSDTVTLNIEDKSMPTRIDIDPPKSSKLDVSSTLDLAYNVTPRTADGSVEWMTSDETVASVDNGRVIPHTVGRVTISVITVKGRKSDSITLTITDKSMPTGITLKKPSSTRLGITQTLTLRYTMSPSTARSSVTWSSSNRNVATVSSAGVVTPHKAGTVTITVTTNRGGKSSSIRLTVYDNTIPTGIKLKITGTYVLDKSEWVSAGYTLVPSGASSAVTWKSSNTKVAQVNSSTGRVTAKGYGIATITATTVRGGRKASYRVKVVDKHAPTSIKITDGKSLKLGVGKTRALHYTIHSGYKGWSPRMNVTVTSNNPNVVKVPNSKDATIQTLKPGTATITIRTDNGKTAKIVITVVR